MVNIRESMREKAEQLVDPTEIFGKTSFIYLTWVITFFIIISIILIVVRKKEYSYKSNSDDDDGQPFYIHLPGESVYTYFFCLFLIMFQLYILNDKYDDIIGSPSWSGINMFFVIFNILALVGLTYFIYGEIGKLNMSSKECIEPSRQVCILDETKEDKWWAGGDSNCNSEFICNEKNAHVIHKECIDNIQYKYENTTDNPEFKFTPTGTPCAKSHDLIFSFNTPPLPTPAPEAEPAPEPPGDPSAPAPAPGPSGDPSAPAPAPGLGPGPGSAPVQPGNWVSFSIFKELQDRVLSMTSGGTPGPPGPVGPPGPRGVDGNQGKSSIPPSNENDNIVCKDGVCPDGDTRCSDPDGYCEGFAIISLEDKIKLNNMTEDYGHNSYKADILMNNLEEYLLNIFK